jgi:hypothetical protein
VGHQRHERLRPCCLSPGLPAPFAPPVLDTFAFSDAADPRSFSADLSPAVASGALDLNTTSFVDHLEAAYPLGRRLAMLASLHRAQRIFQYSLDPVSGLGKSQAAQGGPLCATLGAAAAAAGKGGANSAAPPLPRPPGP